MDMLPVKRVLKRFFRVCGLEVRRLRGSNSDHQVLKDVLRASGAEVILDIGANLGQFALLAFEVGFRGSVVSFEAQPEVHRALTARAAAHAGPAKWIVAPCSALGSTSGTVEMNISENSLSSSLLPMRREHAEAAPSSRYISKRQVKLERLDDAAARVVPPDASLFMKIDTQGYEREVLDGASGLLGRTVAIQVELSLVSLYEHAPSLVEMVMYLEDRGFQMFGLVPVFRDDRDGRLLQVDGVFIRRSPDNAARQGEHGDGE
jgi:FkbM family methyltransferase